MRSCGSMRRVVDGVMIVGGVKSASEEPWGDEENGIGAREEG